MKKLMQKRTMKVMWFMSVSYSNELFKPIFWTNNKVDEYSKRTSLDSLIF